MLDGTSTEAPATGFLPPQVARSDQSSTFIGADAASFKVVARLLASTPGLLLMAGGVTTITGGTLTATTGGGATADLLVTTIGAVGAAGLT
ncbi:MAG: hypothetical protein H7Z77_10895 [Chitinophagaceae bacterium]|nr:hypothetical protein [Polaromonas sp.]